MFKINIKKIALLILSFLPIPALAIVPNDPQYPSQWYLPAIHAPEAWDISAGSKKVVVAVLDTGTEFAHPDLMDNIWTNPGEIAYNGLDDDNDGYIDDAHGWDFVDNQSNPGPDFSLPKNSIGFEHGTIVAGLIGSVGNNATDGAGVAWNVSVMPLKVLDGEGEGESSTVIQAVDYAIQKKADVINMSFIGTTRGDDLYAAINRAHDAGIVIVAAAGNDDGAAEAGDLDLNPHYPVCYDAPNGEQLVIGVAALDQDNHKAFFSGYGTDCVDIAAPGARMPSTLVYQRGQAGYDSSFGGKFSGTSLAAPLVTGAVAILKSIDPSLTPRDVYDILTKSADNIDDLNPAYAGRLGAGKLNIAAAVDLLLKTRGAYITAAAQSPEPIANHPAFISVGGLDAIVSNYDALGAKQGAIKTFPFKGLGLSLAGGDINNDGNQELLVGVKYGGGPQIRIFSKSGTLVSNGFFAYDKKFRGGINLAVGDVSGDGRKEIVTAQASLGNGEVRIFSSDGKLLRSFLAYSKKFRGGVSVGLADINHDGADEIIAGVASGGGPQIRIFHGDGTLYSNGFFAYDTKSRKPMTMVAGDVDGDGAPEIITSREGDGSVNIFSIEGLLKGRFLAYTKYAGLVSLGLGDVDGDGRNELITAPAVRDPIIKIWSGL